MLDESSATVVAGKVGIVALVPDDEIRNNPDIAAIFLIALFLARDFIERGSRVASHDRFPINIENTPMKYVNLKVNMSEKKSDTPICFF